MTPVTPFSPFFFSPLVTVMNEDDQVSRLVFFSFFFLQIETRRGTIAVPLGPCLPLLFFSFFSFFPDLRPALPLSEVIGNFEWGHSVQCSPLLPSFLFFSSQTERARYSRPSTLLTDIRFAKTRMPPHVPRLQAARSSLFLFPPFPFSNCVTTDRVDRNPFLDFFFSARCPIDLRLVVD